MSNPVARHPLLLDACAVINFAASRRFEDLATVHGGFRLVDIVANEAHFVRNGGTGEDADERESIDLGALITAGHVSVEPGATEDELDSYVQFATDLGDGESMTLAIALHRGHTVVTDDRKASRVAVENDITLATTLEIFGAWEVTENPSMSEVRTALINLRDRGRYVPQRNHPLRHWWEQHMTNE